MFSKFNVLIRGGGDIATAIGSKLYKVGFNVIIAELANPIMVRRTVSFSNCIYEGTCVVENIEAVYVKELAEISPLLKARKVVVTDLSEKTLMAVVKPVAFIDGTVSKKAAVTLGYAPIVIGVGPGYEIGNNADAAVESNRGHNLGRVIFAGKTVKNTGRPSSLLGFTYERVLRANCDGNIRHSVEIGDLVKKGELISRLNDQAIRAEIDGVVRGLIHEKVYVKAGMKIGDLDPRNKQAYCYTISDKGRTIAGGVLEALIILLNKAE